MKLTKEQAKMVIEYFSTKAAEEAPVVTTDWLEWDKHMFLTWLQVSMAIERRVNEKDWAALVNAALDWQRFDRDAGAYLYERGELDNSNIREYTRNVLQDVLSWSIDTVFNTSKAA